MTKKALLIGINYRNTDAELNGCINDVHEMESTLKNKYKYNDIKILTEDTELPTKANMIKEMKALVKDCQSGDRLFLHYSGHGSWIKDQNGDEEDGRDEVLVPLDYDKNGLIVDDDLREILVDVCEGVKLYCVFDCCHSGTMLDLRYKYKSKSKFKGMDMTRLEKFIVFLFDDWTDDEEFVKYYNYEQTKGEVIVISGCKDSQTSADAWISKRYQGALTWGLLKTLKDNKYDITYHNLMKSLKGLLQLKGYEQIPQMTSGKKINLDDKYTLF